MKLVIVTQPYMSICQASCRFLFFPMGEKQKATTSLTYRGTKMVFYFSLIFPLLLLIFISPVLTPYRKHPQYSRSSTAVYANSCTH